MGHYCREWLGFTPMAHLFPYPKRHRGASARLEDHISCSFCPCRSFPLPACSVEWIGQLDSEEESRQRLSVALEKMSQCKNELEVRLQTRSAPLETEPTQATCCRHSTTCPLSQRRERLLPAALKALHPVWLAQVWPLGGRQRAEPILHFLPWQMALEDSNARLSSAERALAEAKEHCNDARARLAISSERERAMEVGLDARLCPVGNPTGLSNGLLRLASANLGMIFRSQLQPSDCKPIASPPFQLLWWPMQAQLAAMQGRLEEANKELEQERKLLQEQCQVLLEATRFF